MIIKESLIGIRDKIDPYKISKENTNLTRYFNYLHGIFLREFSLLDVSGLLSWMDEEIAKLYYEGLTINQIIDKIRNTEDYNKLKIKEKNMKKLVKESLHESLDTNFHEPMYDLMDVVHTHKEKGTSDDLFSDLMDIVDKYQNQGISEEDILENVEDFYEQMNHTFEWDEENDIVDAIESFYETVTMSI